MKKQWIIRGIMVALFGAFVFAGNSQSPKSSKFEPDIVDKPKEVVKEIFKGMSFDEGNSEKMPQFPGGEGALLAFIHKNLHYPPIGEEHGIPGRVLVRFVVTKTGEIGKVEVLRSLGTACDNEAIRVIKMLPNFTPGEKNGEKVAVWYTLPISFKHD